MPPFPFPFPFPFAQLTGSIVNGMHLELSWMARTKDWLASTSVSEPQTYALWLAGLAVIGFVVQRRVSS